MLLDKARHSDEADSHINKRFLVKTVCTCKPAAKSLLQVNVF